MKNNSSKPVLIFFLLLTTSCLLNIVTVFQYPAKAQFNQSLENEDTKCKWSGETCSSGVWREICLKDGDGNDCTCGTVTRDC